MSAGAHTGVTTAGRCCVLAWRTAFSRAVGAVPQEFPGGFGGVRVGWASQAGCPGRQVPFGARLEAAGASQGGLGAWRGVVRVWHTHVWWCEHPVRVGVSC